MALERSPWLTPSLSSLFLAILGLNLAGFVGSDCSGSTVVTLPVQNVTVLEASVRRGIPLEIGTPPQPVALSAAGYANNTFLWDDSHGCDVREQYDPSCIVGRGGIFFLNRSSTWSDKANSNVSSKEASSSLFHYSGTPPRGADIVHLNNTYDLYDYPIATTKGGMTLNSLGLAQDSTFLKTLIKKNAIISKTWSLFYGLTGATEDAQMDGVAVFGGFDKAKTKGSNETFPLDYDSQCRTGMVATVTSIDVGFENGTEQNAFGSRINMCLDPTFEIMTFTPSILNQLKRKFGNKSFGTSTGMNVNGLLYGVDKAFTGNLSVTLNSNVKITIPNDQLVVPDYVVLGNETVWSEDSREVLVGEPTGDSPKWMTYLGQPFFTAAYLMVNHELEEFTVWQSNPTHKEDYQVIDSDGNICKAVSPPTQTTTSTRGSGPTSPVQTAEKSEKSDSGGLSTGAIVGIVIGGVAAVGILAGFLAFCCRRRKSQKKQAVKNEIPRYKPGIIHRNKYPVEAPNFDPKENGLVEAPADSRPVFELPAAGSPRLTSREI